MGVQGMNKQIKILIVCLIIAVCGLFIVSCDSSSNKEEKHNYMLEKVEDVPDGWNTSRNMSFYYDINTSIVYVGKSDLGMRNAFVYELKSKDYRNYIYDKNENKFIGVK